MKTSIIYIFFSCLLTRVQISTQVEVPPYRYITDDISYDDHDEDGDSNDDCDAEYITDKDAPSRYVEVSNKHQVSVT